MLRSEKLAIGMVIALGLFWSAALTRVAVQDYPVLSVIANRVVTKYQESTCEQLWHDSRPYLREGTSPQDQEAIRLLRADPQMRAAFVAKIAAPMVGKMLACGMLP